MIITRTALAFAIATVLLAGCAQAPQDGPSNGLVNVTLQMSSMQAEWSSLQKAGIPSDADAAIIEIYLVDTSGRTLDQTIPLALDAPDQTVQLLSGETYDFELSVASTDGTEVAFVAVQAVATPDLVVRLEPTAIISLLRLGDSYYDGMYLVAPIEALTPAGGVAPHADYSLSVTVTGGTLSASSPIGVEIIPDDASSPVTINVTATGLLSSRAAGNVVASLSVTPSSVTPSEGALRFDLVAPTATIHTKPTTISVGYYVDITLQAADDQELSYLHLYVNMLPVISNLHVDFTSDSTSYRFQPDTARTYTLTLVVEDAFGNIGTDTHRIVAE